MPHSCKLHGRKARWSGTPLWRCRPPPRLAITFSRSTKVLRWRFIARDRNEFCNGSLRQPSTNLSWHLERKKCNGEGRAKGWEGRNQLPVKREEIEAEAGLLRIVMTHMLAILNVNGWDYFRDLAKNKLHIVHSAN